MYRVLQMALAVIVMSFGTVALAAKPVDKAIDERLRSALAQPDMGLVVESIEHSEVSGLYAVQFQNGPLVYATEDGRHFVVGDLHEVSSDGFVNLTEKRRDAERAQALAEIDESEMIIFPAKGERRGYITVFTDVTCFYCQKLHLEVPELNNEGIEVRYLAYPRAGMASEGYRKLATAWCAEDQQDTLTRLKAKENVAEKVCEVNPVADQFKLGQVVGVRGTPAIITSEGRLIPGYQPAAELIANLGL